MSRDPQFTRRRFLATLASAAGASAAPFALNLAAIGSAAAQSMASDYKALVCLFMTGGNDHFNTVLATDGPSWTNYQRLRTTTDVDSIALPAAGQSGGVLPITPNSAQAGRSFALHPNLAPVKSMFDAGRVAIVANVGPLIQPATKSQYLARSVPLPPQLFSHNDQQSVWQSHQPEGALSGWGGRIGDLVAANNGQATFTCVSAANNVVMLAGRTIKQALVTSAGAVPVRYLNTSLFGSSAATNPLRDITTRSRADLFENEHTAVVTRAIANQSILAAAIAPAGAGGVPDPAPMTNPSTGASEVNPLAVQLQTVARVIAGRNQMSMRRQVFYVSMTGFDTHDDQRRNHAVLMARLAHAMAYFDTVLASLQGTDLRNQVTLFTASDFGRTFVSNGDGTDHGWGSHHFIAGGAVLGKNIYGTVPALGVGHEYDIGSGALLPTTSVDQYGATLAAWFGLSATQIADVFPHIGNFSTRNLGFMRA